MFLQKGIPSYSMDGFPPGVVGQSPRIAYLGTPKLGTFPERLTWAAQALGGGGWYENPVKIYSMCIVCRTTLKMCKILRSTVNAST